MVLSGLSMNSINVPIPLPHQPFVVLRRVQLVDYGWIVDRHADDVLFVPVQHGPRTLTSGSRALQELAEERRSPDHGVSAPFAESRNDSRRIRAAVRLEQAFHGSHADVRQIDRPDENGAGLQGLQRAQSNTQ